MSFPLCFPSFLFSSAAPSCFSLQVCCPLIFPEHQNPWRRTRAHSGTLTSGIPKLKFLVTACRRAIQTTPGRQRSHWPPQQLMCRQSHQKRDYVWLSQHMDTPFVADISVPVFSHCFCSMPWQSLLRGHRGEPEPCFLWLLFLSSSPHLITPHCAVKYLAR